MHRLQKKYFMTRELRSPPYHFNVTCDIIGSVQDKIEIDLYTIHLSNYLKYCHLLLLSLIHTAIEEFLPKPDNSRNNKIF